MSVKLEMMETETKSDISALNATKIQMHEKLTAVEADLESNARKFNTVIEGLQNDTNDMNKALSKNTFTLLVQNQEVQLRTQNY